MALHYTQCPCENDVHPSSESESLLSHLELWAHPTGQDNSSLFTPNRPYIQASVDTYNQTARIGEIRGTNHSLSQPNFPWSCLDACFAIISAL